MSVQADQLGCDTFRAQWVYVLSDCVSKRGGSTPDVGAGGGDVAAIEVDVVESLEAQVRVRGPLAAVGLLSDDVLDDFGASLLWIRNV
jgi:hypothetical protein